MKKLIITLLSFLMLLCLFGCQSMSKEEKEKIEEIKKELTNEIYKNLILVDEEEYEVASIKQTTLDKLPIAKDDYNTYKINESTLYFSFKIKTNDNKTSTLYILYRDNISSKGVAQYDKVETKDYLRKFNIISSTGDSMPVYYKYHYHTWTFDIHDPELFYHCGSCGKTLQTYNIETESFFTPKSITEEERQIRLAEEEERHLNSIKNAFKKQVQIKGASTYEITNITPIDSVTYLLDIETDSGVTGTVKVRESSYAVGRISVMDAYGHDTNSDITYDLENEKIIF